MSVDSNDATRATAPDAAPFLARAATAERRAEARLATAIDDFFLAREDRLDDRTRAAVGAILAAIVRAVARDLAGHAARQLAGGSHAGAILSDDALLLATLIDSRLLQDRDLMAELLGQARQDLLGEALLSNRAPGTHATLLPRLVESDDGVVAAAALAYLLADNRRRAPDDLRQAELPSALYRRLVWWVAAALRLAQAAEPAIEPAIDRALAAAAQRSLAAHDDQDRLDVAAMRLAAAVDPTTEELPNLLCEALENGRPSLFVALLARASSIDYAEARALVLDPDGDRLWLALRGLRLDRPTIARIGLFLCDADPRRDIDAFADQLDAIAAIPPEAAHDALALLALPTEYRVALRAMDRSPRR